MKRIITLGIILLVFIGCSDDLSKTTIPASPSLTKEKTIKRNFIIAKYTSATVYAGATDYYFEDNEGKDIEFRISNVPNHKKEVVVPIDLLENDASEEGPPSANPLLVGKLFKLFKNESDRIVRVTRFSPPNENQFVEEELVGVWLRKLGGKWEGLQFGNDQSILTFPKARIYKWDLKNDKLLYSPYQLDRNSSRSIYTIESLTENELIISKGTNGKGIPTIFKRPKIKRKTDEWIGKWTGVAGMAIEIYPHPKEAESYLLRIHNTEGVASYKGESRGNKIRFYRNGEKSYIRLGNGKTTGIKYLSEHTHCLYIQKEEGFCRDNL